MLKELHIKNFALIDSLHLDLGAGLNVFTGETGAGKSIILDALLLALGSKAENAGDSTADIQAVFDIAMLPKVQTILKELGLLHPDDPHLLVFRRVLGGEKKSRIYINDASSSTRTAAAIAEELLEVHGQNAQVALLKTSEHRKLLDDFAQAAPLLKTVAESCQAHRAALSALETAQVSESERLRAVDAATFVIGEIESAALTVGEDEKLEAELPALKNGEKLFQVLGSAYDVLFESEQAALAGAQKALSQLEKAEILGLNLEESVANLKTAISLLRNVAEVVGDEKERIPTDPAAVDRALTRLDQMDQLKKKYGTTIAEILERANAARQQLAHLENYEATCAELSSAVEKAKKSWSKAAMQLTALRKKAAEKLSSAVVSELGDLGFSAAQFNVTLLPQEDKTPTTYGAENIEFLFSANAGQAPQNLKDVASGGELSRVMLALKKVLADTDPVPTLIFDEIDTGIGGTTAHALGEKLKRLAASHQILLVTHLAQIAVFADRHINVTKEQTRSATHLHVSVLENRHRTEEIARMLGGAAKEQSALGLAAVAHAEKMLEVAEAARNKKTKK